MSKLTTECSDAPRSFADAADARLRKLEEMYLESAAGGTPLVHVTTGHPRLDKLGLGELGILETCGAHSGDGKSMVRKMRSWNAAAAGYRVQEYSFEDPEALSVDRVASDLMDVDSVALRRLQLEHSPEELPDLVGRLRTVRAEIRKVGQRIHWGGRRLSVDGLFESIDRNWEGAGGETRLVLVDYAQMFDAEGDERSVERVLARLAGRLQALAEERWCTVVCYSQVKREVVDRGRRWLENARFQAKGATLGVAAVQGFRPGDGDLQWSSALTQRSKLVTYIFRPGRWARKNGLNHIEDNVMEIYTDKENFGPDIQVVSLKFDGSRGRLS